MKKQQTRINIKRYYSRGQTLAQCLLALVLEDVHESEKRGEEK